MEQGDFTLQNINLEVGHNQHVCLMGKTGCGKTSLVEVICGLRQLKAGSIFLNEIDVTHTPPAQRGIGYVPQDCALFPHMTVRDHMHFPLKLHHWTQNNRQERVAYLLEALGIESIAKRKPHHLSGGEMKRVALGRALSFKPHFLCLDEPLSALDDATCQEIYQLLKFIKSEFQVSILHITHQQAEVNELADKVYVLEQKSRQAGAQLRLWPKV